MNWGYLLAGAMIGAGLTLLVQALINWSVGFFERPSR